MSSEGTPFQGLDYAASRIYGAHLALIAYTNPPNSLGDLSTYATLTQPTLTGGYAPIVLNGTWTFTNGVVTYLKAGANPRWTCTGAWSATANGSAIVDTAAGRLLHYKDFATPFVAANLRKLEIDIAHMVT
jgi:hypothetical protein